MSFPPSIKKLPCIRHVTNQSKTYVTGCNIAAMLEIALTAFTARSNNIQFARPQLELSEIGGQRTADVRLWRAATTGLSMYNLM